MFFVHIPKSGGTTFRVAALESIGRSRVCGDYGSPSAHTSPVIQQHVYQHTQRNDTEFAEQLSSACSLLTGHVPAKRYVQIVGLRRTAVIVRTPLDRLGSEYFHVYRKGYRESLDTFISKRITSKGGPFLNKFLYGDVIPVQAYGFVGITERYAESLDMFNQLYGMSLKYGHENKAPANSPIAKEDLTQYRADIDKDNQLYDTAVATFNERIRITSACKPYAHGAISLGNRDMIKGWAWWAHSDDTVQVVCSVNGKVFGELEASDKHMLAEFGAPRAGYVGFQMTFNRTSDADVIVCEVAKTGQVLGRVDVNGSIDEQVSKLHR